MKTQIYYLFLKLSVYLMVSSERLTKQLSITIRMHGIEIENMVNLLS